MISAESLCMGCMAYKGRAVVCTQCGYSDHGSENPQQLPPGIVLEGRYVIGRALGQGGFGITYLGWDLELNRKLAIKEFFPVQFSTRAGDHLAVTAISVKYSVDFEYGLNKFAEDAKALTQFKSNPGVVSILDFLYAHGTAYIVMEYVEGRDLKEYSSQHGGKISFETALKILLQVMTALEDVHRAGIVHRDISPDNIYVEANGSVKVLDFGATRYAMGEQGRSLSVVLKPGYAPEEQYRSRGKQGPWTDIYALGATFYRALTGRVPSEAPDRLMDDDLVPPSAMGVSIPPSAERALMKALAVKAENRFQTVEAFREAIQLQRAIPQVSVHEPALTSKTLLLALTSTLLLVAIVFLIARDAWAAGIMAAIILIGVIMFAFSKSRLNYLMRRPPDILARPPESDETSNVSLFRVRCLSGELNGESVSVGLEPIVIGRNPAWANLVISDGESSGRHVRVWQDSEKTGVWIEDMQSSNGTFYRPASAGDHPTEWVRVSGSRLLKVGDHFRISGYGSEFEILAS